MKSVDCLKLAAMLAVTAAASAPTFAADQKMPTTSGKQIVTSAGTQALAPFGKKWWTED
jgi:ABC-type phosphate transport system substrate-binding protein